MKDGQTGGWTVRKGETYGEEKAMVPKHFSTDWNGGGSATILLEGRSLGWGSVLSHVCGGWSDWLCASSP